LTRREREPEAMAVDRGQTGEDQRYFNCGSFGHIAQNYNSRRIVKRNGKMIQIDKGKKLKDNGGQ